MSFKKCVFDFVVSAVPVDGLVRFGAKTSVDTVGTSLGQVFVGTDSQQHIEADKKWPQFCRRHFQMHFLEWKIWISMNISVKFVPKVPIDNKLALVQIMAWCWTGNKLLSEPMMA